MTSVLYQVQICEHLSRAWHTQQQPRTDCIQLSIDAGSDLEVKKSSAANARLSWLRTIQEGTHQELSVIVQGSDAWLKKIPCEAPRYVSSRADYSQHGLGCLSPGSSGERSARLFAAQDYSTLINVGLMFLNPKT